MVAVRAVWRSEGNVHCKWRRFHGVCVCDWSTPNYLCSTLLACGGVLCVHLGVARVAVCACHSIWQQLCGVVVRSHSPSRHVGTAAMHFTCEVLHQPCTEQQLCLCRRGVVVVVAEQHLVSQPQDLAILSGCGLASCVLHRARLFVSRVSCAAHVQCCASCVLEPRGWRARDSLNLVQPLFLYRVCARSDVSQLGTASCLACLAVVWRAVQHMHGRVIAPPPRA
jgi:hypothetical protein